MLDLIEYVARWVRGPVLLVCLARDELLDRRPGWGGGRRNATSISLEPLARGRGAAARQRAASGRGGNGLGEIAPRLAERSGGNPLFAEEMVNRIIEEGSADGGHASRDRALGARRAARLARADRAPPDPARRGRRPDLLGGLADRARRRGGRAISPMPWPRSRRRTWSIPSAGQPARGRARVRVQARADPRRGVRHAPEVGPRPKARAGGRIHRGSGRRARRRGRGAGRRALRSCGLTGRGDQPRRRRSASGSRRAALQLAGRGRRPRRGRCTRTRRRWATTRARSS